MKHWTKKSLILVSAFLVLTPALTRAVSAPSTEFNPHFIISDEEMQNWSGMNQSDIQAFLDDHKGYIAHMQTPDKDGVVKSTAQIIQEAAQIYKINPKYLLVKLQKEQSLITDDDPTQKQLDWATGYGVCDACGMDDPSIQKFKGFGKQIDNAAGIIRWYYDNVNLQTWIKRANTSYNIDGQTVTPVNFATAFLYTYTPHIQGNQNFWKLWQKWFDQIFPDGTLVKSTVGNTIYLIQNGTKRAFSSMNALATRYNPKLVINAPESELVRYPTAASITLPNYSILKQADNYYLLDYDTLRPFANADVVKKMGYNPDEILNVESSELAGLSIGSTITTETSAPIGELIRVKETKQLYFVKDGISHPVLDAAIAKTQFPGLTEVSKPISALQGIASGDPILFQDGTLMKIKGFPEVYVIEHGQKRHITYEAFMGWGLSFKNVVEVDEITGIYHPTGQSIFLRDGMVTTPSTPSPTPTSPTPASGEDSPVSSNSVMVTTPADQVSFVGKKLDTPVDTYLVAEYDSGKIVAGKNIDFVRPLASLTKVLTAYQMMQSGVNLSRTVTYSPADHKAVYHNFRVASGEKIRTRDLLSAMLVSSINTATRMAVDSVEKDEALFIKKMNATVQSLGLTKTKFVDVTGEDTKNVTTAREYLTIFKKGANNIDEQKYLSAHEYAYDEVVDLDGKPHHFDNNTNLILQKTGLPFTILASKTGYLDEAGSNLAMLVQRNSDKKKFIIITMGNPDYTNRFVEPEKLARFSMENF